MASIKRPGVEVTQENVTAQATAVTTNLTSVIVGPCKQIVSAFDDSGNAQAEALAGTYQDGKGTIAYSLPSLKTDATVDSSSLRVFKVDGAGSSTELRDAASEETIDSGTNGEYDGTTGFVDSAASFDTSGVIKGDFVRVTYRGEVVDLEITAAVASATTLTVANSIDQTDSITFGTYSIVRNPAQFVYKSAAEQADAEIGDVTDPETNYLHVAIKSTAASTLVGSGGDGFKLQLKESDADYSIAHAATGTGVVLGTGVGTAVMALNGSAAGPVSTTTLGVGAIALVYNAGVSPIGVRSSVPEIVTIAGASEANFAALSAATALGGSPQFVVGKIRGFQTVTGGTPDYDDSASKTVTFTAGHGITSGMISTGAFVLLLKGSTGTAVNQGLYRVDALGSNPTTQLLLAAVAASGHTGDPGGDLTLGGTGAMLVAIEATANADAAVISASTGAGDLTKVYDYSATSTAAAVLGSSFTKSIVFGSDAMATAAYQTATAITGRIFTTGNLGSAAAGTSVTGGATMKQAQIVDTTLATNFVEPSGTGVTYQIVLPRTNGESTRTIALLESELDANSTFNANFEATTAGSGTFTYAEAATVSFDGGVDADNILVDADLIGSTTATHSVYISYKALRVDLSDQATGAATTTISSTTDVTTKLGTISSDNPLALAAYMATLQSPNTTFKVLGVSATSTTEPDGTTAAYSSALSFLESEDVYAIAALTQDPAIHALFQSHVTSMSLPANKSERIAFVSQAMPTHSTAVLLSSGTSGNTSGTFGDGSDKTFTTNVDFSLNAALTTVLSDTSSDDLILVVSARSSSTLAPIAANGVTPLKYGVRVDKAATSAASDSTTLIFGADAATAFGLDATWRSMVDVNWALYQMGSALTTTAQKATAVAGLGAQFANKRMFLVWPNVAAASVSGSAISMGGEYLAASWAAKVGFESPETPFTNRTLVGFSSVTNSNGLFSRSQLDEIAGGGTYITVQDSPSAALSCRHQLSTKVDTIQNRELSITKTVDFVARQLRTALEPKIGSFLITQSYLDSLGVICGGVLTNLVEGGKLTEAGVNFVEVDSTSSDTVNIQVIISVPFPANYVALTLQF